MAAPTAPSSAHVKRHKRKRSDLEAEEIEALTQQLCLASAGRDAADAGQHVLVVNKFEDLPLSQRTKRALKAHGFRQLTSIQRATLQHTLLGRDVLGAAKTGSGKTLAFLLPLVEKLYRERWTKLDGLGALVISPTRELALQIFDELRKVGEEHELSAGLLIGGKSVTDERNHILSMNVLVCTPGRLLQHLDETPGFDCGNVRVLVLDEADRCMDMGFSATMDAIVANLPRSRHTMLFSATQSKRVSDLARLSLTDPEYVSVHSESTVATPHKLRQFYLQCPLHSKLDLLWFFIKTHREQRSIVFLSTCKQVKFVFEAFRKLRPGVALGAIHGKMKQGRRLAAYYRFNESSAMVLFATDIAARGLDFPAVDWVLQADCPEDAAAYIHRVGRTARFRAAGQALLFLLPSEERSMLASLASQRVPIKRRGYAMDKVAPVTAALTSLMAKSDELKALGQAAFIAYLRSLFLAPDKGTFDVSKLDVERYAASLGLPTVPRLRVVQRMQKQSARAHADTNAHVLAHSSQEENEGTHAALGPTGNAVDVDGTTDRSKGTQFCSAAPLDASVREAAEGTERLQDDDDDDDDGLLAVKHVDVFDVARQDSSHGNVDVGGDTAMLHARQKRPKKIRAGRGTGQRTVFDAEGRPLEPLAALTAAFDAEGPTYEDSKARFEAQRAQIRRTDARDRELARHKRLAARASKKAKSKANAASESGVTVTLGGDAVALPADAREACPVMDKGELQSSDEPGSGATNTSHAAAYAGMLTGGHTAFSEVGDLDGDMERLGTRRARSTKHAKAHPPRSSLHSQEERALQLISQRAGQ